MLYYIDAKYLVSIILNLSKSKFFIFSDIYLHYFRYSR